MNSIDNSWTTWAVLSTLFQSQVTPKGVSYTNTKLVESSNGVRQVEETHYTVYNSRGEKEERYLTGSKLDLRA